MSHRHDHANAIFEVWEILLRYRWRFVVPAFLVTAVVLTTSLLLPRKYRAEALFERRTDAVLAEVTLERSRAGNRQDPRATIIQQLKGAPAIDEMVEAIAGSDPDLAAQIAGLRHDVTRHTLVNWDITSPDLDRVRVSFTGAEPHIAQTVVNTLVGNYVNRARRDFESSLTESADFFRSEAAKCRAIVENLESQVLAYQINNADLLPDSPTNLQARTLEMEQRLAELRSQYDAAEAQIAGLATALANEPETVESLVRAKNPELVRLEEQKRQLRDKLNEQLNVLKMTEAHPEVLVVREQLSSIDAQIAATDREVVAQRQQAANPKRAELEMRLGSARSESQAMKDQIAATQRALEALQTRSAGTFDVRRDYRRLQREAEAAQRQVSFWDDNLRRVELALAADAGDRGMQFTFIRPARAELLPVSPNLAQVLMAALAMGALAGALNVFFTHRTNETFSDAERAAHSVDLPLLGAVSEIVTEQHRRLRRIRNLILYPTNAIVMGGVLLGLSGLLYLDLRQPHVLAAWRGAETSLKTPAATETNAGASINGLAETEAN